jgi:hypothetical protein
VIVDFPTTAENIASMLCKQVVSMLPSEHRLDMVKIRLFETEKTYAEVEQHL